MYIENGDITYSIVESPRPVDTVATYTCMNGFMLIGSAERTCRLVSEPVCFMTRECFLFQTLLKLYILCGYLQKSRDVHVLPVKYYVNVLCIQQQCCFTCTAMFVLTRSYVNKQPMYGSTLIGFTSISATLSYLNITARSILTLYHMSY